MNNPSLFEYLMKHITNTTKTINDFLDDMPGTPEEKQMAYSVIIQYYEAIVQHLNGAEAMNVAACTLYDMWEEEKTKKNNTSRPLAGFDSIRPGQKRDDICSACGGKMIREDGEVYATATYSPKYKYVCSACGHIKVAF